MGRLTTHVLDTANGRPGAGIRVDLRRANGEQLASAHTNSDGRCDSPLLEGDAFSGGDYELIFHAGDYLATVGGDAGKFLDQVIIRFHVESPGEHYHVPLLLSPYGYTTYRGS